jgi:hypothetical protein
MSLARVPDAGAGPENQGPRPKLGVPQIRAVHRYRAAGSSSSQIASMFGVSRRTVQRYLKAGPDPVTAVVETVLFEAAREFALDLSPTQTDDIARSIVHRLRMRGWLDGRPG